MGLVSAYTMVSIVTLFQHPISMLYVAVSEWPPPPICLFFSGARKWPGLIVGRCVRIASFSCMRGWNGIFMGIVEKQRPLSVEWKRWVRMLLTFSSIVCLGYCWGPNLSCQGKPSAAAACVWALFCIILTFTCVRESLDCAGLPSFVGILYAKLDLLNLVSLYENESIP